MLEARFLGKKLGYFRAFVALDTVSFADPATLAAAIPLALTEDADARATILARLSGPLPRNSERVCTGGAAPGQPCNHIETDSVAVIFRESDESVDLFVNPAWVLAPPDSDGLLTPVDAQRAWVQRQLINVAASERQYNFSAAFTSALGLTSRSYLGANYQFVSNAYRGYQANRVRVDDLYYRHDFNRRHYAQIGLMDQRNLASPLGGSFGFTMLPVGRIAGLRVGTTQAYLSRASTSMRTPLTLLLSRPARVAAYRDEQLLGSFYLGAGVQAIDTRQFPPGSYVVRLEVIEDGRLARAERVPFSRVDYGVGHPGDIQWFLQAGEDKHHVSTLPRGGSVLAGIKLALTPTTALSTGAALQRGQLYGESRVDWQHVGPLGTLRATAALFVGNDGSRGDSQQLYWGNRVSASVYRFSKRGTDCRQGNYMSCYRSLSATLSSRVSEWTLAATYGRRWNAYSFTASRGGWHGWDDALRREDERDAAAFRGDSGLPGHWLRREHRSDQFELAAGRTWRVKYLMVSPRITVYTRRSVRHDGTRSERGALASVTFSQSTPARAPEAFGTYSSAGASLERRAQRNALRYQGSQNWSRRRGAVRDVSLNVAGRDAEQLDLRAYGRVEGPWGQIMLNLANNYTRAAASRSARHHPSFTGSYVSSFALSGAGFFFGPDAGSGDPLAGVGIRVDAPDDGQDSAQTVALVGDRPLRAGARALVALPGFGEQAVDIRDTDDTRTDGVAAVQAGAGRRQWFMLPGHLGSQRVTVALSYTYIGRLKALGSAGEAQPADLEGADVLEAVVPSLGEGGTLVADFSYRPRVLHIVKTGRLYACALPSEPRRNGAVRHVGTVNCTPLTTAALPPALSSQRRVTDMLRRHGIGDAPSVPLAPVAHSEATQ